MRSLIVSTVAKFPSSRTMGASSTTGGSGACTRMVTFGVMGRRGRSLRDGLARPASPRRCTLPMTALRVTPPRTRAIWLAERPSVQSDLSCSTLSSVYMRRSSRLALDIVAGRLTLTRPEGASQVLVHNMGFGRQKSLKSAACLTPRGGCADKARPRAKAASGHQTRRLPVFPSLLPTYNRADVAFVRGEGPYIFAEDGSRYLDFGAGVAVNSLGHAHPKLVAALTEQAQRLWHTSNYYRVAGQETLSKRLVDSTFADTAFFGNSGAEAIECAIKMARRYHYVNGAPERFHIITFEGAFHGRTLAAIAAGGQEKYLEGFGPKVQGFDQVPMNNLPALERAITHETAALLIEPIQGEGGIRVADPEFLRALRRICDERGMLLIYDEVQCGVGRTGKFFAHERVGAEPDVMAVAKGIGGGFPMGVCLARAEAAKGM